LLAGRLRNEQAAVAGSAVQEAVLVHALRRMLGAHRVIGTKRAEFERAANVFMDTPANLNQPTEGVLGVRGSRVEQDAVTHAGQGVDALADRARRITAFQGHRGDQQVRKRVEHQVRKPRKDPVRALMLVAPPVEAGFQLPAALLDCWAIEPLGDGVGFELEENAFALVFDGRQPRDFAGQGCPADAHGQLALGVGGGGLEAGETHLGHDLAQAVHEHHTGHVAHPRFVPHRSRQRPRKEDAAWPVITQLVL
jgi:hypothetical protein